MMKVRTKKILVFGIGATLIVIGFILGGCWELIFNKILQNNIALTPTSTSYELWKDTPIPMYLDLYMWNWTNVDEVLNAKNNTVKPILEEHGPYVFQEIHAKKNITWNDNATVTFMQKRTWHFVPEQSVGSLDDKITNVNVIAATLAYAARHQKKSIQMLLNAVLSVFEKHIYVTETVGNLLFDGYDDNLLALAKKLNLPIELPFTKFGWFVDRNNSIPYDGVYTMHTGTDDIAKLGELYAWNYNVKTNFYQEGCNSIYGGLGELGPPLVDVTEVEIFASDFCTAFPLTLNGNMEKLGVVGNKYVGTLKPFDNGFSNPTKKCYCTMDHDEEKCELPGVIDVSKCKFGSPVYVSYPHFYLASPKYRNDLEGMRPQKDRHEFTMGVEPVTGIPLAVRGNLQINIKLDKFPGICMYKNAPQVFMPTIWFSQRADLTEDKIKLVKLLLKVPAIGMGTLFGIAGIGVLLVIIGLVITVKKSWNGEDTDKLVPSTNSDM